MITFIKDSPGKSAKNMPTVLSPPTLGFCRGSKYLSVDIFHDNKNKAAVKHLILIELKNGQQIFLEFGYHFEIAATCYIIIAATYYILIAVTRLLLLLCL